MRRKRNVVAVRGWTTIFAPMNGQRRLSQAISEGDGISLIVPARDPQSLGAAEGDGAEAVLVDGDLSRVRATTRLPIIWRAPNQASLDEASQGGADAFLVPASWLAEEPETAAERFSSALEQGLECVVHVESADELAAALDQLDPEIFLLSPGQTASEEALEHVLDLLEDVPAGKLAIADLPVTTREEVAELERAGVDAVIVGTTDVAGLAGAAPPQV